MYPAFAAALQRMPGEATPRRDPVGFDGDRIAADLATIRIAQLAAPTVLALDEVRFSDAAVAAERLDTRVLRVPPRSGHTEKRLNRGDLGSATESSDDHTGSSS
jgi:hypothetical protein